MIETLFAILLAYHAARVPEHLRGGETESEREARIHDIAQATVEGCQAHPIKGWPLAACVALVATAAEWESGLMVQVHTGEKHGPAGELCLVQLHRYVSMVPNEHYRVTPEERLASVGLGLEPTRVCMAAGAKSLGWQIVRCGIRFENGGRWTAANAFAEYHHPAVACDAAVLPMSDARAGTYVRLLAQLRKTAAP